MFKWLHYEIERFKLNRSQKKLEREYKRKQAEAKEKNDWNILHDWWDTYGQHTSDDIIWSRERLVSDALLKEAEELHLPRPQHGDSTKWRREEGLDFLGRKVLTPEAISELRATIRKEKRDRRETVEWWIKLFGGILPVITGLVGALIGLASVWRHK